MNSASLFAKQSIYCTRIVFGLKAVTFSSQWKPLEVGPLRLSAGTVLPPRHLIPSKATLAVPLLRSRPQLCKLGLLTTTPPVVQKTAELSGKYAMLRQLSGYEAPGCVTMTSSTILSTAPAIGANCYGGLRSLLGPQHRSHYCWNASAAALLTRRRSSQQTWSGLPQNRNGSLLSSTAGVSTGSRRRTYSSIAPLRRAQNALDLGAKGMPFWPIESNGSEASQAARVPLGGPLLGFPIPDEPLPSFLAKASVHRTLSDFPGNDSTVRGLILEGAPETTESSALSSPPWGSTYDRLALGVDGMPEVGNIKKALAYEVQQGFCNSEGKDRGEKFSTFLDRQLMGWARVNLDGKQCSELYELQKKYARCKTAGRIKILDKVSANSFPAYCVCVMGQYERTQSKSFCLTRCRVRGLMQWQLKSSAVWLLKYLLFPKHSLVSEQRFSSARVF
jgi:hypothetical protein